MQQRRLRLGDILDDYCPRERRITNHAVVAMIDDQVKQTRCTTCDADHEYKQAKVPAPRRRKDGVLAGDPADAGRPRTAVPESDMSDDEPMDEPIPDEAQTPDDAPVQAGASAEVPAEAATDPAADVEGMAAAPGDDDGPVHRRLIRATLPRQEGQVPERKLPEFTIRQPGGRGRDFDANRGDGGGQPRHGRARRAPRGPQQFGQSSGQPPRFGGPRQGPPQGQRDGNRPGPPGGQRSGGGGRPPGQARGPGRKRGR
jgi:translation initiation factor IF-2